MRPSELTGRHGVGRTPSARNTRAAGRAAERRAWWFYLLRGYKVLDRNAWSAGNELDLVVRRGRALAFVEVKAKRGSRYGDPVEMVVRINALSSEWGADDLLAALRCEPDAILLPKVDTPRDVLEAGDVLDDNFAPDEMKLWAMIETPKALLNIGPIAELGRDPASRLATTAAPF